jgi:hypothetical protein
MQERDLGRLLDAFYAEGPRQAPDWILDDLQARVETQGQRVHWRMSLRRPNQPSWRLVLIAAILGVLIIVSAALFQIGGRPRAKAGPEFPAPACLLSDSCALGELAAGEHESTAFGTFGGKRHTLTFTVPDGWANVGDTDIEYLLRPRLDSQGNPLHVITSPLIVDQQEPCTKTPKAGVGQTPEDLVAYIAGHPGLEVGTPQRVTINGLKGQYIDVLGLKPDWTGTCLRYTDGPVVVLLMQRESGPFFWWMDPTESTRFLFLDAGEGLTIGVVIDSRIHELFQQLVDAQMPVVQSFSIAE